MLRIVAALEIHDEIQASLWKEGDVYHLKLATLAGETLLITATDVQLGLLAEWLSDSRVYVNNKPVIVAQDGIRRADRFTITQD